MNVIRTLLCLSALPFAALTGCISEAESVALPADTGTYTPPEDSGTDTTPPATESDDAYTYNSDTKELEIDGAYNPYKGYTVGLFCDGCGTEDGFTHAVATIPPADDGSLKVNLGLFGNGADIRWSLALVNDNLEPTQWVWESGVVSDNLVEHDSLGLTMTVQECVGEQMVDKIDFCTQISSAGVMPGSCWGTYVPPADCTDSDNDGDVDPNTDGEPDETGDTGTADDCAGDCAVDDDGDGYSDNAGDCDDGWSGTNPGHDDEWRDGQDNDCDGSTDEGCDGSEAWNGYCSP